MDIKKLIDCLGLKPHPVEGGFFVETYRSSASLPMEVLPNHRGDRHLATAIYYLLTVDSFSEMHRLPGDEIFHFYLGDPVSMLQLHPEGSGEELLLGQDVLAGMKPQHVVTAGVWQGSRLVPGGRFALLGATMAPGFHYDDYESGTRTELISQYPQFGTQIQRLTQE